MTGALRGNDGRGTRMARAFALAAALWLAVPLAHADDGMIVIPGRGETAETALAHANAASGGQFGGNAGTASGTGMAMAGGAVGAGGGAGVTGAASAGSAALPAGSMIVTSVPPPAAVLAPAPRPVYAAARMNAGDGARRAADPGAVATVVAGTAEPASNPANSANSANSARPAIAARMAAARAASAAPAPRAPAAAANPAQATAASPPATPAGQQDPDTIRRTALAFLQQQVAGLPGKTTATVATAFPRGLAACTTLEPFLPTGARLWGRTTVGVRCAGERPWTVYLQAKVAVQATYYVAARQITPGEPLTAADLVARDGDLTVLPLAVITDPAQAVGATALARISAGLPLRQDMLKSAASVSAGQTVRVVAAGPGFTISADGSALANAAPGQSVRVRMAAGQIVTAIVKDAGTVEIPL
ncbi:flagellar biosynthesis protein FlgA [Burkholderia sp. MSMB0856]|uniref:flagellar basal body P-ring formation chaperone FlgA n=1 Tax=Burkholderia sp. MSMB0856 TaxID=1637869 RepID=UPI00075A5F8D|nr:flagellar basal body P-ring formation chaperone FlgA [Burkholderia sp. MSMB0856]AOJ88070.1 flagellar biosynthesis protein FlgA [Burkholderia sp. MSMB0856]KVH31852.1 flagellar biosynthesis protein FlgA [Burkholderia sp. MSMB0856]